MTTGFAGSREPQDRTDERQARQERRSAVVQAAREHSEAVGRHLDRLARYSRSCALGTNAPRPVPRLTELPALLLAVPLSTREGRLGALNVYSRRPGVLGPAALAVAGALADQVGVALTNASDFRR